jgi:hypothetical protein
MAPSYPRYSKCKTPRMRGMTGARFATGGNGVANEAKALKPPPRAWAPLRRRYQPIQSRTWVIGCPALSVDTTMAGGRAAAEPTVCPPSASVVAATAIAEGPVAGSKASTASAPPLKVTDPPLIHSFQ